MADPTALSRHMGGELQSDADREVDVDRAIAELAARQHGIVARRQLRGLGLGDDAIDYRARRWRLHPLHRGVYALGHLRVSPRARLLAAVLAIGPDAALSHRDAGQLRALLRHGRRRIEVTVPRSVRSRSGIEVHHALLARDEVEVVDGIPVTTVPRTLLDLAAVLDRRRLERAIHEAEVQRLWDAVSLAELVERYPRRAGTPAIRAILGELHVGLKLTRNELEALFLALVEEEGLPRPEVNAAFELGGQTIEVDFLWREQRLAVELDGGAVHRTAQAFESDRERDRRLQVAGWRAVRITWRQLLNDRNAVAADLRALLGA